MKFKKNGKQKSSKKVNIKLPDSWLLITKKECDVTYISSLIRDAAEYEIWPDAGVLEVVLGEKSSIDIEELEPSLGDEYGDAFLESHGTKSLFSVVFKKDDVDAAKAVLKKITAGTDGMVVGDTEDFEPKLC